MIGGFIQRIRNAMSIAGDSPSNPSAWLSRLLTAAVTRSGVTISEWNAMTVSDVYKCVRVISESVAMLPCKVYERLPRGRSQAFEHSLYPLLHGEPNPHMTAFTFFEFLLACLLLWGRAAVYIERAQGKVVALWPIRPDRFRFEVKDGQMWFWVTLNSGQQVKFWSDEICYIPGLTTDGYNTYSPIGLHRETLGLSKAAEVFGASFFGNGANGGGYLEHPNKLTPEAAVRLKKSFEEKNSGLDNALRVTVLEEGLKFNKSSIPPNEAQFLETRTFQRSEIAGLFRVPPHKISDLSRATNNNIEAQEIEFFRDCIGPWLKRIEQAFNRSLLLPREKGKIYIEFDANAYMRGDSAARAAFYAALFQVGAYSPNKILEDENENPVPGGDQTFVPMNMVPLDRAAALADNNAGSGTAAAKQRIAAANLRFFRDAGARVVNRKASERAKYAETAFLQPVYCLIECVLGSVSASMAVWAAEYAAKIAAKTPDWSAEMLDETVSAEVDLGIKAVLERGSN